MAFREKVPPSVLPKSHTGIELDVIREALKFKKGHTLEPKDYPLARVSIGFRQNAIQAAMTDSGQDLRRYVGHYADSAVTDTNVFITLKNRNITINSTADLNRYRIVSFQGAAKRYPMWLRNITKTSKYSEISSQETQVKLLVSGRFDVVLSDRNVFKYFSNLYIKKNKLSKNTDFKEIEFTKINPNDYRPIFKSKKVMEDFNEGLRHLKKSGRFQEIYDSYLK
jgi:polar amino acid transport system substrate-binding protein